MEIDIAIDLQDRRDHMQIHATLRIDILLGQSSMSFTVATNALRIVGSLHHVASRILRTLIRLKQMRTAIRATAT